MSKKMMLAALCGLVGSAAIATAQPYFVRGEFNAWTNADPMIQIGPNKYEYVVPNVFAGIEFEFKATVDDWSASAPGSNAKAAGNIIDELHVFLYDTTTHGDGWFPEGEWRLGYMDSTIFDWEIAGSMNSWAPLPTEWELIDMGNGLHVGEFVLTPGTYDWKFRQRGSWSISIGDNFGNAAANNVLVVTVGGPIRFELDLPGGRWQVVDPNAACYADCDTSTGVGTLDIFDFLCFQNSFVAGDPYACDCDTSTGVLVCDIFDFLCFQDAFVAGCP